MILSGEVHETDWSVASEAVTAEPDGFRYRIHVTLESPDGACEREAVIDGLRVGMTWIEMKKANIFTL
ncbi:MULTISPECIES: hypothetical protein [Burkholderia]|jgi:hypothetical protein|uniref:UDP-glucose 4-epimerase n=1 Tax=Burkholderia cenocepacia (strain ATCC BAA-245 / DSM 16553 / LMG 16656 / NCTC 13227 / J2315 / CF5610) TaxID=216591 RepID=B4EI92_BURCJ|nr:MULTISPECIES: hypothetical protein [Burkholderia]KIS51073.1 hypothetical protein NP88_3034 [Burkholderia cepacia]ALV58662.1 UDP-glucose 4-epimerase [Burkholderia cenocepacia]AMU09070.1 hypothetical protein A2T82_22655 [Burkholderia cenocepacia]AMU12178.1 hypothetical protein A3203_03130 [Burkholderia cenocepacia]AQQ22322.1 hypothetical protein A8D61_29895 [Burkholderia cenocepacia]